MGIEPTRSAWKAEVLPLNYIRIFNSIGIIAFPTGNVKQNRPTNSKKRIINYALNNRPDEGTVISFIELYNF